MSSRREKKTATPSLFIFDWDDTIFPTHYCRTLELFQETSPGYLNQEVPREVAGELRKLGVILVRVFRTILEVAEGNVMVISNGDKAWLDMSLRYLGPAASFFKMKKIEIVSARTLYEKHFPNGADQKYWKAKAFVEECNRHFDRDQVFNLVSIGDNEAEEKATQHIAALAKNATCHSIRFVKEPSIKQLTHQINLVEKEIRGIVKEKKCQVYSMKETKEYKKWCDKNNK